MKSDRQDGAGFAGAARRLAALERHDPEALALERFFGWVKAPKTEEQLQAARRELLG